VSITGSCRRRSEGRFFRRRGRSNLIRLCPRTNSARSASSSSSASTACRSRSKSDRATLWPVSARTPARAWTTLVFLLTSRSIEIQRARASGEVVGPELLTGPNSSTQFVGARRGTRSLSFGLCQVGGWSCRAVGGHNEPTGNFRCWSQSSHKAPALVGASTQTTRGSRRNQRCWRRENLRVR